MSYLLIVDDDEDLLVMMDAWVRPLNMRVEFARNGVEALDMMQEELPAFVILDLMMPKMDGFSVLGRLKLDPEKRSIPILVVTAGEHEDEHITSQGDFIVGVLRKGQMEPGDVIDAVRATLGN